MTPEPAQPAESPEALTDEEVMDEICDLIRLECWFEGKTLTIMHNDRFVKLRLVGIKDKPSAADLRGEP